MVYWCTDRQADKLWSTAALIDRHTNYGLLLHKHRQESWQTIWSTAALDSFRHTNSTSRKAIWQRLSERQASRKVDRARDNLRDLQREVRETDRQKERRRFCLFGFLTSSSATRLYRGRTPRQIVWQLYVLPHMRQSWETMTFVSVGHIILTPTQPVGRGRPQRKSNARPPTRSRALYRLSYRAPPPPPRGGEREREGETDRETERQRDRETERETETEWERWKQMLL